MSIGLEDTASANSPEQNTAETNANKYAEFTLDEVLDHPEWGKIFEYSILKEGRILVYKLSTLDVDELKDLFDAYNYAVLNYARDYFNNTGKPIVVIADLENCKVSGMGVFKLLREASTISEGVQKVLADESIILFPSAAPLNVFNALLQVLVRPVNRSGKIQLMSIEQALNKADAVTVEPIEHFEEV